MSKFLGRARNNIKSTYYVKTKLLYIIHTLKKHNGPNLSI